MMRVFFRVTKPAPRQYHFHGLAVARELGVFPPRPSEFASNDVYDEECSDESQDGNGSRGQPEATA